MKQLTYNIIERTDESVSGDADDPEKNPGEIWSVEELLTTDKLCIPAYQRPYKWTPRQVGALFSDIVRFRDKPGYRLGTIVFHQEGGRLNLVDGQQRTITLLLIVKAILDQKKPDGLHADKWKDSEFSALLEKLRPSVNGLCESFKFVSDISVQNIQANYHDILTRVVRSDFSAEIALFLIKKCEVVVFTLDDISEAFQFFDSQNARGKDLDPHDLLKAYHLREFGPEHEQGEVMTQAIEKWEALEASQLAHFFESYWFRIRRWSRGESARYFGKADVDLFKGINLSSGKRYPNGQLLRIAHFYTDHYQNQYERQIDGMNQAFPFQFDQTILNGKRFFEMTSHYLAMSKRYTSDGDLHEKTAGFPERELNGTAKDIMSIIDKYEGRFRRGDQYVRNLFDCLLLFYIDRFGMEEISRAIEKIFIWAYRLRLNQIRVQLASIDKYALAEPWLFHVLRDARSPHEFLEIPLSPLEMEDMRKDVESISSLFKDMNYLKEDSQND